jgi:hypothetical protein
LQDHHQGCLWQIIGWLPDNHYWLELQYLSHIEGLLEEDSILEIDECIDDVLVDGQPVFPHSLVPEDEDWVGSGISVPLLPREVK